jgi:HEAT repeat protein
MYPYVAVALAFAVADRRPAATESLDAQLRALAPERRVSSRLAAADWCMRHARERPLPVALTVLERAVRADPSPAVRAAAVAAVGAITRAHDLPCPEVVFSAMLDGSAKVRFYADIAVAESGRLTPAGIAALARVADSNDPERRTSALFKLGYQSGKDPAAGKVIRRAMTDPSWWVRRAAHLALYWTTRKFDETVPYLLACHAATRGMDALPPGATETEKDEAAHEEIAATSDFAVISGIMKDRPDEAVPVLMKMTEDTNRLARLGVVMYLNWDSQRVVFCTTPLRKRISEMAAKDKDSQVRSYARKVLDRLPPE